MAAPLTEDIQDEESDDLISSISILEKHAESDLFFTRQKVARGLPDTLRAIFNRREDVNAVVAVMCRLSHDPDPNVRVELINQVPHLAILCRQWKEHLGLLVRQHLVPLLVDAFSDDFPAVRKSSHNAFLILLKNNLVEQALLEEWLCPLVAMHTIDEKEEERRLDSLTLMCKMASFIERDLTEKFFRWQYLSLCDHTSLAVRKACAEKMDEMCAILGTPNTETHLLPKFLKLCADKEWEVRKACVEAFTAVSWMCSLHTRHNILAPCFLKFLRDSTVQVKASAYQTLGPFIYTFGDPTPFNLFTADLPDPFQVQDMNLDPTEGPNFHYIADLAEDVSFEEKRFWEMHSLFPLQHHHTFEKNASPPRSKVQINTRLADNFNSFQYWQVPLPDIRELLPLLPPPPEKSKVCVVKPNNHRPLGKIAQPLIKEGTVGRNLEDRLEQMREDFARVALTAPQGSSIAEEVTMGSIGIIPLSLPQDTAQQIMPKDVVPPALLEHYLSMADPVCKLTGLAEHCAFSLAAVAMALGPDGWPRLRPTCHLLSGDVQWQVRRSLAASLHELAAILGPSLAAQDLLPTFCSFVQDMDEVRTGLMDHLTDFIRVLNIADRKSILPHLPKFLRMDNENNWRYRMAFAHQLMMASELFPSQDIKTFILPLALILVGDKVSAVRLAAVKLMAILLRTLSNNNAYEKSFFAELGTIFKDSAKWSLRQMYVFLCDELVSERALPLEQLACEVAPNVLLLSWDQVANVRLAVARWLNHSLPVLAHLTLENRDLLLRALAHLDMDTDSDVQYVMSRLPPALLHHVPSASVEG